MTQRCGPLLRTIGACAAVIVVAVSCSAAAGSPGEQDRPPTTASELTQAQPTTTPPSTVVSRDPHPVFDDSKAGPPFTVAEIEPAGDCVISGPTEPAHLSSPGVGLVPSELSRRLDSLLADEALAGLQVSASVLVEGYGQVLAHDADEHLLPASNQKLITAAGVAELLPLEDRFVTEVYASGPDLVFVASGDPTLDRAALGSLVDQIVDAGISDVDRLVIDAGRFTGGVSAPGWLSWQLPRFVGPLSAFMVDDNRYRDDADFIADPARANGELFATLLVEAGVGVESIAPAGSRSSADAPGLPIAHHESATFGQLVETLLASSDNQHADQLMNEIGARFGDGSIADGTEHVDRTLGAWCIGLTGRSGDGSGLSRANRRSANDFTALLEAARDKPWGRWFEDALPVAGRSGTLSRRFVGTVAEERVWAKTGTIRTGISLSGYARTVAHRDVVFSVIVNGDRDRVHAARSAMDALVVEVVAWPE